MFTKKTFLTAAAFLFIFTSGANADISDIEKNLNSGEVGQAAEAVCEGTVATCGDVLNVRTGPSTDNDIIGTLDNFSKVQITGEQNGWYKIKWNGADAWVCGRYINKSEQSASPDAVSDASDAGASRPQSSPEAEKSSEPVAVKKSDGSNSIEVPQRCQYMEDGRGGGWCGPTSLGMLMEHYGVNISTEDIAAEAYNRGGQGGTNPEDLDAFATSKGFKVSYSEDQGRSLDYLKEKINASTPVIVSLKGDDYWRGGHYLIVRGYNEEGFVINDPSDRNGLTYTMPYNLFSTMWHGSNDDWGCFAMTISK